MIIRDAKAGDLAALRDMWCRFMAELHTGQHPSGKEGGYWVNRLQSQLSRGQVAVAKEGRHLQGFAGFIEHSDRAFVPSAVAFIVDLYVAPAFRRQEIGKVLLRYVMKRAAENGCERVWTNTEESNRSAQGCLEKAGFRVLNGFALPGLTGQRYYQIDVKREGSESAGAGDPVQRA